VVPLLLLVVLVLAVWLVTPGTPAAAAPSELEVVVRVRDAAGAIEGVLRLAQDVGIGRLTVVDEGSRDLTAAIVTAWARRHPGVALVGAGEAEQPAAPAQLVLDLRYPGSVGTVERVLRWWGARTAAPAGNASHGTVA
jgi:hypothetical protein